MKAIHRLFRSVTCMKMRWIRLHICCISKTLTMLNYNF